MESSRTILLDFESCKRHGGAVSCIKVPENTLKSAFLEEREFGTKLVRKSKFHHFQRVIEIVLMLKIIGKHGVGKLKSYIFQIEVMQVAYRFRFLLRSASK